MPEIWAYCETCSRWYSSDLPLSATPPCADCGLPPSRVTDRPVVSPIR